MGVMIKMVGAVIATMVALLSAGVAVAQSGGGGCTSVLISMAPCVNYVTGTSTTPSSSCCSQLANVVRSNPRCLCEVLSGGAASLGVSINKTLALQLPASCNVKTPPVSRCNDGGGAAGPAGAPTQAVPGSDTGGAAGGFDGVAKTVVLVAAVTATYVGMLL